MHYVFNDDFLFQYKDEVDHLNENNRCRPRAQLVRVVQFENNKIKELQKENQELKQALEENQNAMELIMSKYREHVFTLSQYAKLDFKSLHSNYQLVSAELFKISR